MSNRPNDPHFKSVEEARHREHAQRREAARAGDGTIEQGEAELERIRARRKIAELKAANDDLKRQLDEVTK